MKLIRIKKTDGNENIIKAQLGKQFNGFFGSVTVYPEYFSGDWGFEIHSEPRDVSNDDYFNDGNISSGIKNVQSHLKNLQDAEKFAKTNKSKLLKFVQSIEEKLK